jgi:hypothetical protein
MTDQECFELQLKVWRHPKPKAKWVKMIEEHGQYDFNKLMNDYMAKAFGRVK